MSAGARLQAAVVAHLAGTGRVFDAPPTRAAMPYVVVAHPMLAAGDAVGIAGRSGTIAVTCIDDGARPDAVRALLGTVETAMASLPAQLDDAWRVTSVRLARSAVDQGKTGRWTATSLFTVRMFRSN